LSATDGEGASGDDGRDDNIGDDDHFYLLSRLGTEESSAPQNPLPCEERVRREEG
jgi:hypothetical protein